MNEIISLSALWLLPLGLLLPLVLLGGFRLLLGSTREPIPEEERDWSAPQLDATSQADSPIHRWDARFKIVSLLTLAFLIVSLQQLEYALIALILTLLGYRAAKLPLRRGLQRIAGMTGFLAMFLIMLPLTAATLPGDTLLVFGGWSWLSFNLRGLQLAVLIILRACSVALLMEPLFATAPMPTTLAGLTRIGIPARIAELLLLAHRYLFVFLHEARRIHTGMEVRGYRKRTNKATLRSAGHFLGMLFVRSFERTERVHAAMLARGYSGSWPVRVDFSSTASDFFKAALVITIGITLIICDRLYPPGSF
jgi:cobalt/nickel transport system permease protein